MGKKGSWAVACPDSLRQATAAPTGDTHVLSDRTKGTFSGS